MEVCEEEVPSSSNGEYEQKKSAGKQLNLAAMFRRYV